jgi:plasmid stability protein
MATIQIRNIPDEDYEALRDAAKAEGKSLQSYMQEQAAVMARRARKVTAFKILREALANNRGTGVTTETSSTISTHFEGPGRPAGTRSRIAGA